ncbi:MAG: hypothetical protein PHS96_08305 [Anaerolineales bacterium]|nr:hypothetical protein [Anaerolineales bacterium]
MPDFPAKTRVVRGNGEEYPLNFLDPRQVLMVDEALSSLGEYGEVRLVIEKGRLRFLITNRSFDVLTWCPGTSLG